MSISKSDNEHEGVTYSVSPGEKLSRLPVKIRNIVDEFDRKVFLDPDAYITSLAGRCEHPAMQCWLSELVEGGFVKLQIHTADIEVGVDHIIELRDVYFDFRVGDSDETQSLQFRKKTPEGLIHSSLRPVFDLIELIDPFVWGCAGGQLRYEPGPGGLFSNMGWMEPSDDIDAEKCQQLHTSTDGNVIGCHEDGSAIWCDHGRMERLGPINDFMNLYFQNLANQISVVDSQALVAQLRSKN